MAKKKPVILTGKPATLDDVCRIFKISKKRRERLVKICEGAK